MVGPLKKTPDYEFRPIGQSPDGRRSIGRELVEIKRGDAPRVVVLIVVVFTL